MISMPVVHDERCRLHEPGGELFVGVRTPGTETPARLDALLVTFGDADLVESVAHDDTALLAVHDRELVEFLSGAWEEWERLGIPEDPGADRVTPYVFAHKGLGLDQLRVPAAAWARPGYFAYDTMTLVGPGTWEAARGAVDAALTASDLVADGAPHAYACVRPPGHHACRRAYGGSCYLNNSAIAAWQLARGGRRVGVLDVDAHHGNGTQELFWDRDDVLTASVHVDPGAGWFPHFLGFADEEGGGANLNLPVAPGSGDDVWLTALAQALTWLRAGEAEALVVPLGVDAAGGDPESPLEVTQDGFRRAGELVGSLGLPTVLVQEGGYDLETLGPLVLAFLDGVESAP
jgi:acetoin utilization deacetylase AcuC-like enzyme